MIEKLLNDRDNSHTVPMYLYILWSLASYVPLICLVMKRESVWVARRFALTSQASRRPARSASYSASLLETWKLNSKAYVISFVGVFRICPSLDPSFLAALLVYSSQMSQLTSGSEGIYWQRCSHIFSASGISTNKSSKAWALMLVHGR